MLKVVHDSTLSAIGDAIRQRVDTDERFLPSEMPSMIAECTVGYDEIATGLSSVRARGLASAIAASAFSPLAKVLVEADFANAVTVGASAFMGCTLLTEVSLASCESVGTAAFESCHSLSSISLPACSVISDRAFRYCSAMTEARLPNVATVGVASYGNGGGAFESCRSLSVVEMPNVVSLLDRTFANCTSLSSIDLPSCVTLGSYALSNTAVANANMPACARIGTGAFYGCTSLLTVNASPTTIGANAFRDCRQLSSIDTTMATTIEQYAFRGCSAMTSYCLDRLSVVNVSCFELNVSLSEVSLPVVTSIYTNAFMSCTALGVVSIGDQVRTIGANAFAQCTSLSEVYIMRADSIPTLVNANAFNGMPGSLFVPDHLIGQYGVTANWSALSSRMTPVGTAALGSVDAFASGEMPVTGESAVTIDLWSRSGAIGGAKTTAGQGGFNVRFATTEPGVLHEVEFDMSFDGATFGTDRCGWYLAQGQVTYYQSSATWPDNIPRDTSSHHHVWRIVPSSSTFCATFYMGGLSQGRFEMTNIAVRTARWDL